MLRQSQQHLQQAGKAYGPHGTFALKQGIYLWWLGVTSIVHALIPAWFPFYTQQKVIALGKMAQKHQENQQAKTTAALEKAAQP